MRTLRMYFYNIVIYFIEINYTGRLFALKLAREPLHDELMDTYYIVIL
jgi:hypothetical protein